MICTEEEADISKIAHLILREDHTIPTMPTPYFPVTCYRDARNLILSSLQSTPSFLATSKILKSCSLPPLRVVYSMERLVVVCVCMERTMTFVVDSYHIILADRSSRARY